MRDCKIKAFQERSVDGKGRSEENGARTMIKDKVN